MQKENSNLIRVIPMKEEFLGDKKMNDIIYGFLQTNSYLDNRKRYCWKNEVTAGKIIDYFKEQETESPVCERTIRNLLKLFIKINLLEEGELEGKKVYFLPDSSKPFVQIKTETLRFLVNTANTNVIKVYAYLKNKWENHVKYKFKNNYRFSEVELLAAIGYKANSSDNYQMIKDILQCLQNNELIKIHKEYVTTAAGKLADYYEIDFVSEDYKHTLNSKAKQEDTCIAYPVAETVIYNYSDGFRF